MKNAKKIIFIVLLVVIVLALVACNPTTSNTKKPDDPVVDQGNGERKLSTKKPSDIKQLSDLEDYGKSTAKYQKAEVSYSSGTYAGTSAATQVEHLQYRINQKNQDVVNGKSDSSFIKIFAMSTPDGLLERMGMAALTYDEMSRVVDYLYGSEENPNLDYYIKKDSDGWSGKFTDGKTSWTEELNADNSAAFNAGWSFFDDWDLYDRLKEYTEDFDEKGSDKDLAGDNAAWQYRSILEKVYTKVRLDGDAAARLATYMLDYAVDIVNKKSGGNADSAIVVSASVVSYGPFAEYCKRAPLATDPFYGLQDYETLSYLLAFNKYYEHKAGLSQCVTLYGYYYDYNKTYYFQSLADEATYTKQLKYEKQKTFTDEEWLDYVDIQRNNYAKAYRYSESFYDKFYAVHFEFQGIIEDMDASVYQMAAIRARDGLSDPKTTYTQEMRTATTKTGSINGIKGQLSMSDWMWCYSESNSVMKAYNKANTDYENGKNSGDSEKEYEGKFYYEMEQLYIVHYLLSNMNDDELSGALYYQVYAYSASMVSHMQKDIKDVVYIEDGVEEGSTYTSIDPVASNPNQYAIEKTNVIYGQTYSTWSSVNVPKLGQNAGSQAWSDMQTEIKAAIDYDYMHMAIDKKAEAWKERCERMEDLVVVRVWSCCGQKVHEATEPCEFNHIRNRDGSKATKDYDTEHTISLFVSDYEQVLYHIASQTTLSFVTPSRGYLTDDADQSKTWTSGYTGTIEALRAASTTRQTMNWDVNSPKKKITVSSGEKFVEEIADADSEDKGWWTNNKTAGTDAKFDSHSRNETINGSTVTCTYSYVFKGWYLDQNCKYAFNENDKVDVNLTIYAGYDVTKSR